MDTQKDIKQTDFMQPVIAAHLFHMQDKVDLFEGFRNQLGDDVYKTIEKVESDRGFRQGQFLAEQTDDHSIESLIRMVWEPLRIKGFEFTMEKQDDGIQIRCTQCPVFEMAKQCGATQWFFHHTCQADADVARGFNPHIGMKRTQTLMQGNKVCDHFYYDLM